MFFSWCVLAGRLFCGASQSERDQAWRKLAARNRLTESGFMWNELCQGVWGTEGQMGFWTKTASWIIYIYAWLFRRRCQKDIFESLGKLCAKVWKKNVSLLRRLHKITISWGKITNMPCFWLGPQCFQPLEISSMTIKPQKNVFFLQMHWHRCPVGLQTFHLSYGAVPPCLFPTSSLYNLFIYHIFPKWVNWSLLSSDHNCSPVAGLEDPQTAEDTARSPSLCFLPHGNCWGNLASCIHMHTSWKISYSFDVFTLYTYIMNCVIPLMEEILHHLGFFKTL